MPLQDGSVLRCGDVVLVYEARLTEETASSPEIIPSTLSATRSEARIPGDSLIIAALRAAIARVAPDPAPALIMGETGTGKEVVAQEIHRLSGRSGEFVALNCAALSPQLVESQLFGHVRGAFTGATVSGEGMFRAAHGGTLFLDEIGELPLELQPKLLRALQERRVRPVGATRELPVDVRILAATNQDLEGLVKQDRFRRDLFARLRMHELRVPALRERRADILPWIQHFSAAWRADRSLPAAAPQPLNPLTLNPQSAERILCASWPDNLRGLDHLVHRYAHLSRALTPQEVAAVTGPDNAAAGPLASGAFWAPSPAQSIGASEASSPPTAPGGVAPRKTTRRPSPSREALLEILQETQSVRGAARHFDRDRRQIYRWIAAYKIAESEFQPSTQEPN